MDGWFSCRHSRQHLFSGAGAGHDDGVHLVFRALRHLARMSDRRFHVPIGGRFRLIADDIEYGDECRAHLGEFVQTAPRLLRQINSVVSPE
jgi:hypothetical protein